MGNKTSFQPGRSGNPETMFKSGQSANPNGRPKAVLELRNYAREFGHDGIRKLAVMAGLLPNEPPAEAEAVRVACIKELLDRGYGKAPLVFGDDADAPHVIEFRWANATTNLLPGEVAPGVMAPTIEAAARDAADDADSVPVVVWADGTKAG
jgi:hypothetical protein